MPRYEKTHKTETRRRIVDNAGRRLKGDGIDRSGIATIMSDSGLTNGAFYAHFDSKSDLVACVIADQLAQQAAALTALPPGREAIEQLIRSYLSVEHRDDPANGCPNAALLDEIGRCDDRVRETYGAGVLPIIDAVARCLSPDNPTAAEVRATGLFTLIVGCLQLARAVSDPVRSKQILAAGIDNALALLDLEIAGHR